MFEGDARAEGVCVEWRVVLEWGVVCFRSEDVFEWRVFVRVEGCFRVKGCLLRVEGCLLEWKVVCFRIEDVFE